MSTSLEKDGHKRWRVEKPGADGSGAMIGIGPEPGMNQG